MRIVPLLSVITFLAGCGDEDTPLPPEAPEVAQIRAHGVSCGTDPTTGAPYFTVAPGQYGPTVEGRSTLPGEHLPAVTTWTPWVGVTFFYRTQGTDLARIGRTERGIELTIVLEPDVMPTVLRSPCTIPAN